MYVCGVKLKVWAFLISLSAIVNQTRDNIISISLQNR